MKLAFTVLGVGLAVTKATEGEPGFLPRPTFRKPFPDPALFRQSQSRRLAPEGGKPERLRFEVEDGGYQFNYEFAGAPKVEHVFNLDSEGVQGIRCTAGQEGHLEIFWANLTVAAATALRKDAVISGSPEWQCSLSIPRNSRIQSSGPLLRILEVEALASSRSLSTRLRVVPTSPVEIFRDLYIDLSWHPVGRLADRRLQACSTDHHYSLNYDCESQRASQSHVIGPFTCSNCYALLDITPDFKLQTNSLGQPTRISLQLSATFEANLELGFNGLQSVSSDWTQLFSQRTGNLLNTIGFVMPMFGSLVSAINSWTVNMGIYANYELKGQADVRSILQGVLQTKRVYEWTGAEVGWTSSEGFFYTLGVVSSSGNTSTPDLKDFSADLAVALAPCVSLDLNYDQETMSSASACLEGNVAYLTERAITSVAADAVGGTSQANDEQLCLDLYKFETDGDLELLGSNDPYAGWCFMGKCHYTGYKHMSSGEAAFDDGWSCMNIRTASLRENRLYVEVWEDDTGWDEVFTERGSIDLTSEAMDFDKRVALTPSSKSGGTYAYLSLKVRRSPLRLLSQTGNESSTSGPCGQSLYAGAGMSGGLSGFKLPSVWEHNGTVLVDPISLGSVRTEMQRVVCKDLPAGEAVVSFSTRSGWLLFPAAVVFSLLT